MDLLLPVPNNPPRLEDRGLARLGVRDCEPTPDGEVRRDGEDVLEPIRLLRLDDVAPTVGRR